MPIYLRCTLHNTFFSQNKAKKFKYIYVVWLIWWQFHVSCNVFQSVKRHSSFFKFSFFHSLALVEDIWRICQDFLTHLWAVYIICAPLILRLSMFHRINTSFLTSHVSYKKLIRLAINQAIEVCSIEFVRTLFLVFAKVVLENNDRKKKIKEKQCFFRHNYSQNTCYMLFIRYLYGLCQRKKFSNSWL